MVELMTIIHNGGLLTGVFAVIVCFAIIAFWPEDTNNAGVADWEREGWL